MYMFHKLVFDSLCNSECVNREIHNKVNASTERFITKCCGSRSQSDIVRGEIIIFLVEYYNEGGMHMS